jgi:hypothetical protein
MVPLIGLRSAGRLAGLVAVRLNRDFQLFPAWFGQGRRHLRTRPLKSQDVLAESGERGVRR